MKKRALAEKGKHVVANFDLEAVIYLPKSNRTEIFYKRRLSCYNFTIYDLGTGDGYCYFSHEGVTCRRACRGSNEISSYLLDFLKQQDEKGVSEVTLFSDGCVGQNKNTITITALLYFIQNARSVQNVAVYFFVTDHGQSEGDSMHSTIERRVRSLPELFLPSQLATTIQMARKIKTPYVVKEVSTDDIKDFKSLAALLFGGRIKKNHGD